MDDKSDQIVAKTKLVMLNYTNDYLLNSFFYFIEMMYL